MQKIQSLAFFRASLKVYIQPLASVLPGFIEISVLESYHLWEHMKHFIFAAACMRLRSVIIYMYMCTPFAYEKDLYPVKCFHTLACISHLYVDSFALDFACLLFAATRKNIFRSTKAGTVQRTRWAGQSPWQGFADCCLIRVCFFKTNLLSFEMNPLSLIFKKPGIKWQRPGAPDFIGNLFQIVVQ